VSRHLLLLFAPAFAVEANKKKLSIDSCPIRVIKQTRLQDKAYHYQEDNTPFINRAGSREKSVITTSSFSAFGAHSKFSINKAAS